MVIRSILLAFCCLLFFATCAGERQVPEQTQPTMTWHGSIDQARLMAQETGDLVLLSFEAPWCPWSRLMRDSVYVDGAVVASLTSFRCVAIDVDQDTALVGQLGIVLYPTIVVTDAYGGELGRMVGYHPPEEFLKRLRSITTSEDMLSEMFRQEDTSANDPTFLISFGRMLLEMGMYDAALIRYDRAIQMDQDDRFGTLEEATYSMAECYMLAGELREAGRRFRLFTSSYPNSQRLEQAAILAARCYQQAGYSKVAAGIYRDYLKDFEKGSFAAFARSRLDSLEARRNHGG